MPDRPVLSGQPNGTDSPAVSGTCGETATAPPSSRSDGAGDSTASSPQRYQPMQFHAKGGLGEVFRAEDRELNREVALKRIQQQHASNADSRRRFLVEAEVTARLEHPGIVPVYGLVHDDQGQPSYAMRFIQGETLLIGLMEVTSWCQS